MKGLLMPTQPKTGNLPAGGPTGSPIPPTQVPADLAAILESMVPIIDAFRAASTTGENIEEQKSIAVDGGTVPLRLTSNGLLYRIVREHTVVITLENSAATAQVVDVSTLFPFNLISNEQLSISTSTVIFSCSGEAGLFAALRTRRGSLEGIVSGKGLSPALCRVVFGAGITPTAATANSVSGYGSISIAATTTSTITATFYEVIKTAFDRNNLVGVLPIQNNRVNVQLNLTLRKTLGDNDTSPLYVAGGAPGTLTLTSFSDTINTTSYFWSVPADPTLYAPMVENSFQTLEDTAQAANSGGVSAMKYLLQTEMLFTAIHILARDNNGALLPYTAMDPMVLTLSAGNAIVATRQAGTRRANDFIDYGDDRSGMAGYALWDGNNNKDDLSNPDDAGWVDTFNAANPTLAITLPTAGVAYPVEFSATREIIIPGNVTQSSVA